MGDFFAIDTLITLDIFVSTNVTHEIFSFNSSLSLVRDLLNRPLQYHIFR